MSSLRTDGEFTFYVLQHKEKSSGKFVGSSLDHFGSPKGFNASGDCWQQTGNYGVFDIKQGVEGLHWIAEKHKGTQFRLVKVCIKQISQEVATIELTNTEEPT